MMKLNDENLAKQAELASGMKNKKKVATEKKIVPADPAASAAAKEKKRRREEKVLGGFKIGRKCDSGFGNITSQSNKLL